MTSLFSADAASGNSEADCKLDATVLTLRMPRVVLSITSPVTTVSTGAIRDLGSIEAERMTRCQRHGQWHGKSISSGVCKTVGKGVGTGVGADGCGVGKSVGKSMGESMGKDMGKSVCSGVGSGMGKSIGKGIGRGVGGIAVVCAKA